MRATLILLIAAGVAAADPNPSDKGTPEREKATALVKQLGDKRYATREAAAKQLIEMGPAAVPALTDGSKSEDQEVRNRSIELLPRALVKQLGDKRYVAREAAAKQLIEMGPTAVAALTDGSKSDDEEVRNRSIALLPQAKAAEWKRRAAAYRADAEGKKHDLPQLDEWERLVGKPDAGSRKLFAEMVITNGELLDKATDRRVAATACAARCKAVLAQARGPKGQIKAEVGDVAAILFVDTLVPTRSDWSTRAFPAQLLANPTAVEAIGDADMGPAFRRLVVKWMQARDKNDPTAGQQFALFARKKPFAEAAPILIKLAKDKSNDVFTVRVLAIEALGKVGGKDAAAALADLVPDNASLFGGGGPDEHRVGDVALAASLTMHGKNLNDFGMRNNFGIGFATAEGEEPISITLHGFANAAAREKAVKKWKEEVVDKKDEKKEEKKDEKK